MRPISDAQLEQTIAAYERLSLDRQQPPLVDPVALLDGRPFTRIQKLANFWQAAPQVAFRQHAIDLMTAARGYEGYLTFVLAGDPQQIQLYFALDEAVNSQNLLRGAFPGIGLQQKPALNLGSILKNRFAVTGMISGIPSLKENADAPEIAQTEFFHFERLIRGLRDSEWVYVVQAYSRPEQDVLRDRQEILAEIAQVSSIVRQQIQQSRQASSARTNRASESLSEMVGGEIVNRQADYLVQLLERQLERLDAELAVGRWQTAVYFGATEAQSARRLGALLSGILSGAESKPDRIRAHFCLPKATASASDFHTYLSSSEAALLIQLPREEAPGYAITDLARFDVDYQKQAGQNIILGRIQWHGFDSGRPYGIQVNDLARHGVVFGVTGSGKTTTLLNLLHQLWQKPNEIPFLVIEPAKTEYRALLGRIVSNAPTGPMPDLRVFTLGNDTTAPFRLNPFEFETDDERDGAAVLSHIDFLKAVFNAAFILYAPMPYVLETALHEVYEDKGWNLATGGNVRFQTDEEWKQRHRYPIFPTLTDLYHKVAAVTARLGYEARIEQDVIAGLKARLGALRLGAKGLMLDTPRGIAMADLLAKPTVLELESIGNDEEKTFLMGLLLARLYGFRRSQAAQGKLPGGLQHVLVIEEAHRLLKNVSTAVDTESSNLRAQGVETFVNMLSEVRHYGQGVLVAEQIPAKLTPDVVKNTNLKVVHRLLAQDDRDVLGATMNMSESQSAYLTALRAGEAVVYAEGDDHPLLLKVDNFKEKPKLRPPVDRTLPPVAERYIYLGQYLSTPDYADYGLRVTEFGRPSLLIYQAARRYLDRPDHAQLWAQIIARVIFARNSLPDLLERMRRIIAAEPGGLPLAQQNEALVMWAVLGAAQALQVRGAANGWSYPAVDNLRIALTGGLVKLIRAGDLKLAAFELDRFVRAYESSLERERGPYPGCHACRAICAYRSEVDDLLTHIEQGYARGIVTDSTLRNDGERYGQLAKTLRGVVRRWLGENSSEVDDLAYCAGLTAAVALGLDEYEQGDYGRRLAPHLLV